LNKKKIDEFRDTNLPEHLLVIQHLSKGYKMSSKIFELDETTGKIEFKVDVQDGYLENKKDIFHQNIKVLYKELNRQRMYPA
jgi:hypothetical protein